MIALDWLRNIVRAAMLDVDLYNRAEQDRSLGTQALAVVIVANVLSGIGSAIATDTSILVGGAIGAGTGVVGWLLWSLIAMAVGTRLLGGTSDFGEMRRVIGFAYAPLAIGVIPWLGFVGAVWALVAAVIAIREGMEFSTQRAIATMAVGWVSWLVLSVIVQAILGFSIAPSWPL